MGETSKIAGKNDAASTDLPGRKLATSKTPRMLTPPEIELLRQDLKAALSRPMPRVSMIQSESAADDAGLRSEVPTCKAPR